MAEHFDAMLAGARAIGKLPSRMHCRDGNATARVYEDEMTQVHQKILRCLDMRVMDGDLVVLTCLRMPTLILPTGCFMQMYYDPDAQGQYASQFLASSQGFMQPRGDIRMSIVPRGFCGLPTDVREFIDQYFHREELDRRVDWDEEEGRPPNRAPLLHHHGDHLTLVSGNELSSTSCPTCVRCWIRRR